MTVGGSPPAGAQLLQGHALIPGEPVTQVIDTDVSQLALPGQLVQITAEQPFERRVMGGLLLRSLVGRRLAVNLRDNVVEQVVGDPAGLFTVVEHDRAQAVQHVQLAAAVGAPVQVHTHAQGHGLGERARTVLHQKDFIGMMGTHSS